VIPVLHETAQAGNAIEDFRDADGKRYRASRAAAQVLFARFLLQPL
jgi:hypothetical protein